MNIGIVSAPPEQTIVDKMGWVADGFIAAGHSVRRVNTIREVGSADKHCDLLLFDHKGAGVCRNALADMAIRRKAIWVQWWRDAIPYFAGTPLRDQPYIQSFLRLMRQMDAVLVKERALLPEYQALGIKAHWFDQACPANMPKCEHRKKPEWDVLVPGVAA